MSNIIGCLYFVRWSHQSMRRNKNAKQRNKEATKLGWKGTGASLGQDGAWGFPQLHHHTLWGFGTFPSEHKSAISQIVISECKRQTWYTGAGASWACRDSWAPQSVLHSFGFGQAKLKPKLEFV